MDKSNVNQIGQMKSQKQKSAAAWMNRTEHKVSHGSGSDLMSWSRSTPDALHLFICTDWVRRPESRWSSDNEKHQPNRMHANGQFIKKRTGTRNGVTVEGARLEAQVAHHCLLNSRLYTNRFHKDCCWKETYTHTTYTLRFVAAEDRSYWTAIHAYKCPNSGHGQPNDTIYIHYIHSPSY